MRGSKTTTGLHELLTTRYWMINFDSVPGFRAVIERNLNTREPFVAEEHVMARAFSLASQEVLASVSNIEEDDQADGQQMADIQEDFISVVYVREAITRNGGLCSSGSIQHRDTVIEASKNPHCLGHIFYIDTPGGSANAIGDYELAIQHAHAAGQPVLALIDGYCASLGMYLASFCDERYYMHPQNQVGSIGVMAAFYGEKDGAFNQYTNETYHELYDPESYDKNKAFRDIINDGNADEMLEHLAITGKKFRADVKAHCPNVTDEMLHGRLFDAKDVEGALVDGQSTLEGCFARIQVLRKPDGAPAVENGKMVLSSQQSSQSPEIASNIQVIDMNQYPTLNAVLGMAEGTSLEMTEEGAFMQADLLDRVEQHLADEANEREQAINDQREADAAHEAATLAEAQQQHDSAIAQLNEQHANELAALREQIQALTAERDSLTAARDASVQERDQIAQERDELQQQLTDTQATLAAATAAPQVEEQPAPSNNGTGLEAPKMVSGAPKYDPRLTPVENAKAMQDYLASLRKKH